MKTYMIHVNGVAYEVQVEEVGGQAVAPVARPVVQASSPAPQVAAKPAPAPAPQAAPAPKAAPSGQGEVIKAPIPGTIYDLKVQSGATVKAGDILLILEAMKMENEIMAPRAGTVKGIFVTKGQSVNSGDPLVELE